MPHVDEGTLHALLDGALRAESPGRASEVEAHLAACGDCRARLEAAAELRGEASGILDAAIAEDLGATPAFEDVVRRGEATAPGLQPAGRPLSQPDRRRRQARWTRGVAWAASLVIALGTGYLMRDLAGPTADDRAPARGGEAVERAAPGSDPLADEAADRATNAAGDGDSPVDPPPAGPTEPPTTELRTESTEPVPTDAARDGAPAPEPRADANAEADAEAKTGTARETAAVVEPEAPAERLRVGAQEGEAVELAEISTTGFQSAAAQWSAITVEAAREILDGPLYILPRAELVDLYTRADTTHRQVLSLQRLQSGVPIQVVQWRGEEAEEEDRGEVPALRGDTPAANAALPRGALPDANVVRVVRDEFILELTGSLPAGLLSVLAETADPAS